MVPQRLHKRLEPARGCVEKGKKWKSSGEVCLKAHLQAKKMIGSNKKGRGQGRGLEIVGSATRPRSPARPKS
jgi:hypothetical protein